MVSRRLLLMSSMVLLSSLTALVARGDKGANLPAPLTDASFLDDGAPDDALVDLGRNLFFDPILSGNRNISCGTCHDPALGSGDGLALGIGEGGIGAGQKRATLDPVTGRVPRNAQPLWNIGAREYVTLFHDGRVEWQDDMTRIRNPAGPKLPEDVTSTLEAQAFFPVTSAIEMAGQYGENAVANAAFVEDRPKVWTMLAARVAAEPGYFKMLRAAYPQITVSGDVAYGHLAKALAAFQTVAFRSDKSPFDDVLRSRDLSPLSAEAQDGLSLFYGKANCVACHSGPLLTDHAFHAIAVPQIGPGKGHGGDFSYIGQTGLAGRTEDEGRYRISRDRDDLFAFRTPSLRNVTLTGPWGHSGAFDTLEDMVRHHLNPVASLEGFDVADIPLPDLERIQRLAGRGSEFGFAPLDDDSRAAFDLRDTWVMRSPALKDRIAAANDLRPIDLSETEIKHLLAFLETLTDPTALDRSQIIPERLPSKLPPQPDRSGIEQF